MVDGLEEINGSDVTKIRTDNIGVRKRLGAAHHNRVDIPNEQGDADGEHQYFVKQAVLRAACRRECGPKEVDANPNAASQCHIGEGITLPLGDFDDADEEQNAKDSEHRDENEVFNRQHDLYFFNGVFLFRFHANYYTLNR